MNFWVHALHRINRRAPIPSLLSCTLAASTGVAQAEPGPPARWADHSALTTGARRLEVGVFSQSSYAVNDRLELRTHPLWFFVLPQLHAKFRWLSTDTWHFSSSHGLSYPTPFLDLVAKEGTLGLLPSNTEVPQALLLHSAALLSARAGHDQWLTLEAGVTAGPRTHDTVLLDFPFLYARFAALNAPVVPHVALGASGMLSTHLGYAVYSKFSWLPLEDVSGGYSWESDLELGWSFTDDLRLALSAKAEYAKFPVGTHWYWYPLVDLRMAW